MLRSAASDQRRRAVDAEQHVLVEARVRLGEEEGLARHIGALSMRLYDVKGELNQLNATETELCSPFTFFSASSIWAKRFFNNIHS